MTKSQERKIESIKRQIQRIAENHTNFYGDSFSVTINEPNEKIGSCWTEEELEKFNFAKNDKRITYSIGVVVTNINQYGVDVGETIEGNFILGPKGGLNFKQVNIFHKVSRNTSNYSKFIG